MDNRYLKGCICVALSAIIFGCMPLVAKYIYADGIDAMSLVFYRNALSLPVLFLLLRYAKSPVSIHKQEIRPLLLLALFGTVATPTLLFLSYKSISAGTATTLHFTYPVFVMLGCAIFLRERMRPAQTACAVLCTIGILFFYTPGNQAAGLGGMLLAFASGLTLAIYIIYLPRSGLQRLNPFHLSFLLATVTSLSVLVLALLGNGLAIPTTPSVWLICIGFSLALSVGAVVFFQVGTFIIGPQRAAILSTFEPITSIALGVLLLNEAFHWRIALGAFLILTSVVILTVTDKKSMLPQEHLQPDIAP